MYPTRLLFSPSRKHHGRKSVDPPADGRGVKAGVWIVPDDAPNLVKRMYSVFCKFWLSQDDGTQQDRDIAGYLSKIMDKYGEDLSKNVQSHYIRGPCLKQLNSNIKTYANYSKQCIYERNMCPKHKNVNWMV